MWKRSLGAQGGGGVEKAELRQDQEVPVESGDRRQASGRKGGVWQEGVPAMHMLSVSVSLE